MYYRNDQRTQEIMLCALLAKPWKDTDFVAAEEHGYMCPISVVRSLADQGLVIHDRDTWTLTEAGRIKAENLYKKEILDSLVNEHDGKIAHKEVKNWPAIMAALNTLRHEGFVERQGATWRITVRESVKR